MSRYYQMDITVRGFKDEKRDDIEDSLNEEWEFDGWDSRVEEVDGGEVDVIYASGCSNLCGGETEEEFTKRVTEVVWRVNDGFCSVHVLAIYLEDPPSEAHELSEDDYKEFARAEKAKPIS